AGHLWRCRKDGEISAAMELKHRRAVRRYRVWFLAAAGAAVGMFSAGPANADLSAGALVTECDRLAAAPTDPNREGPGVAFDRIDTIAAIESCEQALARNPGNSRVMFNLGRANDRADRLAEAARLYRLAADQGYTAARHSLGVFYLEGLGG